MSEDENFDGVNEPTSRSASLSESRHIIVRGKVQGVGFRHFVRTVGDGFGLNGEVRNLDDGRVEINVSGPSQQILAFIEQLELGPSGARVDEVEVQEREDVIRHEGFIILR